MVGDERIDGGPRSAIVVGAGIVGLSTAWFLQERGVDVTVVDRTGVAAGASWGNAGWIAPALTLPLNSPAVLRDGLRSLRDPAAPLHIPLTADSALGVFLVQFAANCRRSSWKRAVRANVPLNEECIEAFDVLTANGVDAPMTDAPITAVFRTTEEAERMMRELRQLENAGQTLSVTGLSDEALREQVPLASPAVTAGLNINGQRFIDPGRFVVALGRAVACQGCNDAHAGSSQRVQLRQRCHGLPAQRHAVNRRHRGDRHRRLVIPAGGRPGARPGAGRPRLLVYRARGPPHPRPHLPAGRAGGVHALPTAHCVSRAPWSSATRTNRRYPIG